MPHSLPRLQSSCPTGTSSALADIRLLSKLTLRGTNLENPEGWRNEEAGDSVTLNDVKLGARYNTCLSKPADSWER